MPNTHLTIGALAAYIAAEQDAGRMRADDAEAAAMNLVASCFMRSYQRGMQGGGLPSPRASAEALARMLAPA